MKKLTRIVLSGMMAACLAACGTKKEETKPEVKEEPTAAAAAESENSSTEMGNPMKEVGSLEEMNKECNTAIKKPGAMGVSDETFFVIEDGDKKIAEYNYTIAGRECTLRSAPIADHDISGWWPGGVPAFDNTAKDGMEFCEADSAYLARWFTIDGQFVFVMKKGEGVDEEYFHSIAQETATIHGLVNTAEASVDYASLTGEYADSVSQRASMTLETNDGSALMGEVKWGQSADETAVWRFVLHKDTDGAFRYDDCTKLIIKGENNDEETVYKDGHGFFTLSEDGKFHWDGAEEEECRSCVFERIQ